MNLISLPVIALPALPLTQHLIPANVLADYFTAGSIIDEAQQQAQQARKEAEDYLSRVELQCQAAREQALQEGRAIFQQEIPSLRQQIVEETVAWIIAEQQLEQEIISRLSSRLRTVMITLCSEFITQSHGTELLIKRLEQHLEALRSEGDVILSVSAGQYAGLARHFTPQTWLQIKIDPALHCDDAILSTPLCSLSISLSAHRSSVLARLGNLQQEEMFEYQD